MVIKSQHTELRKPKLTDAERHKRFVETAKKVGASDKEQDFDEAVIKIIARPVSAASTSKKSD